MVGRLTSAYSPDRLLLGTQLSVSSTYLPTYLPVPLLETLTDYLLPITYCLPLTTDY